MNCWRALTLAAGLIALAACSSTGQSGAVPLAVPAPTSAQRLPLGASAHIGTNEIRLEVALTPDQQATGLMFRTGLPADRGMVFPVEPAHPVSFWMKGTLIPLDIIYLRDGIIRSIAGDAAPCDADPCARYPSIEPVDEVLEIRAGLAAEAGLAPGDPLPIRRN